MCRRTVKLTTSDGSASSIARGSRPRQLYKIRTIFETQQRSYVNYSICVFWIAQQRRQQCSSRLSTAVCWIVEEVNISGIPGLLVANCCSLKTTTRLKEQSVFIYLPWSSLLWLQIFHNKPKHRLWSWLDERVTLLFCTG